MTQAIINNAGSIALNPDVTLATTTSQSRRTKFFRRGPFQMTLNVGMNPVRYSVYRSITGILSSSLIGPYSLTLPSEVVGEAPSDTITINGGSQTGNTVDITSTASTTVLEQGDFLKLPGVVGTYIVADDVTTDAAGDATVNLNQPMFSSPTDATEVDVNDNITFSMLLIDNPEATQDPSGIVFFSNAFVFVEDL